jgi:murein DD-endopeptidase MepM/ murein hydrolase activator NlpD
MLYLPGSNFTLTSLFVQRTNPITRKSEFHGGVDFVAPVGALIPAASEGQVVYSGFNGTPEKPSYGNVVVIKSLGADGNIYYTLYAHMNGVAMPALGDYVLQGETIGQVGNTGLSTGSHVSAP